jgi:fructose-1,6-bisphosphatase
MRYFFVSDIHGEYKKLISALKQTGFNEATDTLVSVGDPFDRGPDNEKVLQFLLGLPNKILLWGNHDARLKILVDGTDDIAAYDFHNCTTDTIR